MLLMYNGRGPGILDVLHFTSLFKDFWSNDRGESVICRLQDGVIMNGCRVELSVIGLGFNPAAAMGNIFWSS